MSDGALHVLSTSESFWLRLADLGICGLALISLLVIMYWGLRDLRTELRALTVVVGRLPVRFVPPLRGDEERG